MKRLVFLFFCFLMTLQVLQAQHLSAHRNTVGNGYNFWLYTPEGYVKGETAKPLVVFLHGKSLSGHDLNRVKRYGTIAAIEMGLKLDAIVIAPQCPGGGWKPDRVMNIVEWVKQHHTVDTNRIYVLGMSMGGYGTINFAGTYPDKVAAAMALCGGGTLKEYCGLNELPLWILHGTADRAVGVGCSQKVVDAMKSCGKSERLIWTRLQGMNHGSLARAFYLPETYQWLFAHSLADTNRPVNRDFVITPSTLSRDAYRAARQGGKVEVVPGESGTPDITLVAASDKQTSVTTNETTKAVEPSRKYHTVRKGDTLGAIARKHHTTVKKLCRLNNIKETTTLQIGRRLRVR